MEVLKYNVSAIDNVNLFLQNKFYFRYLEMHFTVNS